MQEKPLSSSSKWAITCWSKLQFFIKMRRFFLLHNKPTRKMTLQYDFDDQNNHISEKNSDLIEVKTEEAEEVKQGKSEKSDELLETKTEKREEIEEVKHGKSDKSNEIESGVMLQKAVTELLFGKWEDKENATMKIKILASEDAKTRKTLAELGVIPLLVSMVDSNVVSRRLMAVQALIELSNGTFTNKVLILKAGILLKLPTNIEEIDEALTHELSLLILSISSLFNSQFPFNQATLFSFLVSILQSNSTTEKSKETCLGTLYNLSNVLDNSGALISNRVVEILLSLLSSSREKISEQALATLANLVVTLMGKKALEDNTSVPERFIDILTWEDRTKCQEISAYILMILAHQSYKQREKMAKLGIVHTLLEVALLGSSLAQKRALKLLQWFKDERQIRVGPHSGPQTRFFAPDLPMSDGEASQDKRLMKKMVQQSLYKNMEVITRRANVVGESSKLKSLVISSSSKSLPY